MDAEKIAKQWWKSVKNQTLKVTRRDYALIACTKRLQSSAPEARRDSAREGDKGSMTDQPDFYKIEAKFVTSDQNPKVEFTVHDTSVEEIVCIGDEQMTVNSDALLKAFNNKTLSNEDWLLAWITVCRYYNRNVGRIKEIQLRSINAAFDKQTETERRFYDLNTKHMSAMSDVETKYQQQLIRANDRHAALCAAVLRGDWNEAARLARGTLE